MKNIPSTNGGNGAGTPNERDSSGRFAIGNRGGPGNPYARRVARLRSQILDELTDADLHDVVRKLIDKAKDGDLGAVKLLFSYAAGRPVEPPCPPDQVDVHELTLKAETLNKKQDLRFTVPLDDD